MQSVLNYDLMYALTYRGHIGSGDPRRRMRHSPNWKGCHLGGNTNKSFKSHILHITRLCLDRPAWGLKTLARAGRFRCTGGLRLDASIGSSVTARNLRFFTLLLHTRYFLRCNSGQSLDGGDVLLLAASCLGAYHTN